MKSEVVWDKTTGKHCLILHPTNAFIMAGVAVSTLSGPIELFGCEDNDLLDLAYTIIGKLGHDRADAMAEEIGIDYL